VYIPGAVSPTCEEVFMAGPFKAVIFDLDDTLFDCAGTLVEASRRRAARALVEAGLPMTEQEAFALQERLAEERGPHFLVLDEIGRRYGLGHEAVDTAFHAYNSEEVEEIRPFSDVVATLRFLRRQGFLCFLLTAGLYPRQMTKIRKLGLEGEFDEILVNDLERGVLLSECMRYFLDRYGLHPHEALVVGDRPQLEIRAGKELGMGTAQMLHGKFSTVPPRDYFEIPDYRINRVFQIPTLLRLANLNKDPRNLRIVVIGGGTGLPIVLEGCKPYCHNLTAIVAVTDSGRSSGRLRDELGMLPPGDARNCLVALSESGHKERLLNRLFQYRFTHGSLNGMSLGNLVIAALTDMEGSFDKGIKLISELLNIRGKVLPATVTDCHVCAELEDGTVVERELNVRATGKEPIKRVFLQPPDAEALQEAVQEISTADMIVIGPGSLYTSVLTNLLVPGIRNAVAQSHARTFYVCNIMTQPGQTDGFTASDHLREIQRYLGENVLDGVLVNCGIPSQSVIERYRAEGAHLVEVDPELRELGLPVCEANLMEQVDEERVLWEKQDLLRHHPDKLGDTLWRLYAGMEIYSE